jgi:site-specific DNA-methyltransferase (cytosine-N4-specific)
MKDDIILHGDVYACLDELKDNSIAVAITSPPYWKQRDYGFEDQIGQEDTPEEYIGRLVVIFNKLRKKLREDGLFFLNIGDKYLPRYGESHLLQIPYRLAYHMIKNGWYLEDILVWFKTNHMPSSVKNRFANTYEPIFVFSKNKRNIYHKNSKKIVKIPLQQTQWEHTAVFPEKLIEEILERVKLVDGDVIVDPFAGTGTVAAVIKKIRSRLSFLRLSSVMIERGDLFIEIIKKRTGITLVKKIKNASYEWNPVKEEKLPLHIKPKELLTNKNGEVFIADTSDEFLSLLKGITTEKFKIFHREDALYFFGIKNWTIQDLYYIHSIFYEGYILRNMLVISNGEQWYPVFMFAKDSKKVKYRFYIDRIRKPFKSDTKHENWQHKKFIGMKVKDITGKKQKEGIILKIINSYDDGFPKVVVVKWNNDISLEFVLHPKQDIFIRESLKILCPKCKNVLKEPNKLVYDGICSFCKTILWNDGEETPIIEEPEEIVKELERLKNINYKIRDEINKTIDTGELVEERKKIRSKFAKLKRINWGASPGARKLILGEYFTKMRLYKVDQPIIGQILNVLRKLKNLSIQDIANRFPKSYRHTVGHWFRKDRGGSIPVPSDIPMLKKFFGKEGSVLTFLERTALKFQTVKELPKGKTPGDFIEGLNEKDLIFYFKKLYS